MPKMRISMFAAAVMSTSLVVAAPAHADDGSDFLTLVSGEGINVGDTPEDVQLTLASGKFVCHLLHGGYTPDTAVRVVRYSLPDTTPQQVAGFVGAAQATLCVNAHKPLQLGG